MPDTLHAVPNAPSRPRRLLVVCPSWLGDCVMATPALRRLREALPGAYIGGLVRPGMDELFAGCAFFDELHVERAQGVMGPKLVAARVRPRRYDAALLLTNSFSTALIARLAGIPRRIGFDRDGRGVLLTDRLRAPKLPGGRWAPVPAVAYYWRLADALLEVDSEPGSPAAPGSRAAPDSPGAFALPPAAALILELTDAQDRAACDVLARAGAADAQRPVLLNPGGNDERKRWPIDRFARLAEHLAARPGTRVLVNAAPGERPLAEALLAALSPAARSRTASLADLGITIGSLKGVIRRCALMVTNDTGPRHIAAAFGVPRVVLFGPTDPRWTALPPDPRAPELALLADPELPPQEVADDHPERCRIDRIPLDRVVAAAESLLFPPARPGMPDPAHP